MEMVQVTRGSPSDLGGQRVIMKLHSLPSTRFLHLLMIPIVCLHSKTKTKEYEVTCSVLYSIQCRQDNWNAGPAVLYIVDPQDQGELEWPKQPQPVLFGTN